MATTGPDTRFINKTKSGFPGHLDWELLRTTGLKHIGKLSGKLWTDHNVHDPGVTILEVLCYALMDLGYRTCLPTADILAGSKPEMNDFHSPSDLLTCNPLTITDYRKLLVDIPGVRNAWLENSFYACDDNRQDWSETRETFCSDCYNGLYRVLIETEFPHTDPSHPEVRELLRTIRSRLLACRNICEDFIDIRILCKKKLGLCVDLELEKDASPDSVYPEMIAKLSEFFSPAPKFYTLGQMLVDKNKTIDQVFAGRPYDLKESHGFVDTEELEEIKLRKELHLSDVFKVLLSVTGVRSVIRLGWKRDGTKCIDLDKWVLNIPEFHVVEFSPELSSVTFSRQGIPVPADVSTWNAMLEFTTLNTGKVAYKIPSPYLEAEFPKGVYREDLADYVSLQHDFPRVYGIDHGGLPADASERRRAQALQLKAYLLFFDHLLAGYLAQLKNVRTLLSAKPSRSKQEKRTYYSGNLNQVPDIDKLMRFQDSDSFEPGKVLARLVDRRSLEAVLENPSPKKRCEQLGTPRFYKDRCSVDLAIQMWNQEVSFNEQSPVMFEDGSGCWGFYLVSNDPDTVLLGETLRGTREEAAQDADMTRYAGSFIANFRRVEKGYAHSFIIELQPSFYAESLQNILESPATYLERRNQLLDHLLSRFAERFTVFSLLSFHTVRSNELQEREIGAKEAFLHQYPDLSSNRGRGYNYPLDGWNNTNLSGFEKRVMALTGTRDLRRKDHCNFVVQKFDEYYLIIVKSKQGEKLLEVPERFYSFEAAKQMLLSLAKAMTEVSSYDLTEVKPYSVKVRFSESKYAYSVSSYPDVTDASLHMQGLIRLFNQNAIASDVVVNTTVFRPQIVDDNNRLIATCTKTFQDENKFRELAKEIPDFFNSAEHWKREESEEKIILLPGNDFRYVINWAGFKANGIYIKDHPDKVSFQLLDKRNSFILNSAIPFNTEEEAIEFARQVLFRVIDDPSSLRIQPDREDFKLQILQGDLVLAEAEFDDEAEAERTKKIVEEAIRTNHYTISFPSEPNTWRYTFTAGHTNRKFIFKSWDEYDNVESAMKAADRFHSKADARGLSLTGQTVYLTSAHLRAFHEASSENEANEIATATRHYLELRTEMRRTMANPHKLAEAFIVNDIGNRRLQWVYRLVDKENVIAVHSPEGPTPEEIDFERKKLFQSPPAYQITEIVLSEDVIITRKGPKNRDSYSYQIIQRRPDGNLILFESVYAFASRERAWQAFLNDFMIVLGKARDDQQYGPDKPISLIELVYDPDNTPFDNKAIVFIPEKTKENFNQWYDNIVIEELVKIASQYPIRYSTKESDEFYRLFPCEEDKRDKRPGVCQPTVDAPKYFYFVLSDDKGEQIWQSTGYYPSREQATEQFRFFLTLLQFPGNFIVEQDRCGCLHGIHEEEKPCECRQKIYIREVLAESTSRFTTPQEAWLNLEKFICVSQEKNAFHSFQRTDDCSYTFDIFCRTALIHPRTYHSPRQRNESVIRLHKAFAEFASRKFPRIIQVANGWHILDPSDVVVAQVIEQGQNKELCLADFFYLLFRNIYKYQHGVGVVITNPETQQTITIRPPDLSIDPEQWARQLYELFRMYYIVRKDNKKYYLSIRLKGYGLSESDLQGECGNDRPAWISACGFDSCSEANEQLEEYTECLADFNNYRGTFECDCGPYRIELICPGHRGDRQSDNDGNDKHSELCFTEIVAYNPQRYHTPKISCDAIARSKRLINSEGLHLIEHILLRPTCPEDCRRDQTGLLGVCIDKPLHLTDQPLTWKIPPNEQYPEGKKYNFVPGADPYSFIATVILPAWPERFRTEENRSIVEDLLYREIPSHVLLRVFWLRPVDFCQFEEVFKRWTMWLGQGRKPGCLKENPIEELLNCLTGKQYTELPECEACRPKDTEAQPAGCFEDFPKPCKDQPLLKKVNDLFCWNKGKALTLKKQDKAKVEPAIATEHHTTTLPSPTSDVDFFLHREELYRTNIETIDETRSPVVAAAREFMKSPEPDKDEFLSLAKSIIENPSNADGVRLSVKEQKQVLESTILFYLDKLYATADKSVIGKKLPTFFASIDSRKLNRRKLFDTWMSDELKAHENKLAAQHIWKMLTGD